MKKLPLHLGRRRPDQPSSRRYSRGVKQMFGRKNIGTDAPERTAGALAMAAQPKSGQVALRAVAPNARKPSFGPPPLVASGRPSQPSVVSPVRAQSTRRSNEYYALKAQVIATLIEAI